MIILGIETSCDETSAAILSNAEGEIQILSNIVASSAELQSKYGGIIPEQAAREQLKAILPVIQEAIVSAELKIEDLDAIAVTYGPGLIGSLLVGVETAKVLATIWNKPLIPINHLLGHFYANWISESVLSKKFYLSSIKNDKKVLNTKYVIQNTPRFPCLGLLVSGGHTDLVLFTAHNEYKYLGGTLDDAAGECFDKCARLLGLPYPGGPQISKLAQEGNPYTYTLPTPLLGAKDLNFSYSGLKTAVANLVAKLGTLGLQEQKNLAASIEQTIVKSLSEKVLQAYKHYPCKDVLVAGGVAANQVLNESLLKHLQAQNPNVKLHIPPPYLCTDNGAMIAAAAFFSVDRVEPENLQANPNLSLS